LFAPDDFEIREAMDFYLRLEKFRGMNYNPFLVGHPVKNKNNRIKWGKDSLKDLHFELGDYRLFIATHTNVGEHLIWNDIKHVRIYETAIDFASRLINAGLPTNHEEIELLMCGAASSPCLIDDNDAVRQAWRNQNDKKDGLAAKQILRDKCTAFDAETGIFKNPIIQESPMAFKLLTSLDMMGFKSLEITAYHPIIELAPDGQGNIEYTTKDEYLKKGQRGQRSVIRFTAPQDKSKNQKNVETFTFRQEENIGTKNKVGRPFYWPVRSGQQQKARLDDGERKHPESKNNPKRTRTRSNQVAPSPIPESEKNTKRTRKEAWAK
jgi:hypothetical protein